MKLEDKMYDAVADVSADLAGLTVSARREGLALRRHRRVLGAVGGVAAAVVLAAGVGGYISVRSVPPADAPWAGQSVDGTALSGRTEPLTGRNVAGALTSAVRSVADGETGSAYGRPTVDGTGTHPATGRWPMGLSSAGRVLSLRYTPRPGAPASVISVELDPAGRSRPPRCAPRATCHIAVLSNGDRLMTSSDGFDDIVGEGTSDGPARHNRAMLWSPARNLSLDIWATNVVTYRGTKASIVRQQPDLSTAQLAEIARMPWWGLRLPVEFERVGEKVHFTTSDPGTP